MELSSLNDFGLSYKSQKIPVLMITMADDLTSAYTRSRCGRDGVSSTAQSITT